MTNEQWHELLKQYPIGNDEALRVLEAALQAACTYGVRTTTSFLQNGMVQSETLESPEGLNDLLENVANLVDKTAQLVSGYSDDRRPCLVGNHKHWFLRWQTRKWICDPSPLQGGGPGGPCEVTMAIVEDQETGQVQEVYPREVRFLDRNTIPESRI